MTTSEDTEDRNLDPISGAPGAHPLGTSAGATSAAAAGAAIGVAVGGPVGFVVGGAIGAVAGAVVGHNVAEQVNPTAEDTYWHSAYASRPYVLADREYSYYQPAFRYGWESRAAHKGRTWDEVEGQLNQGWAAARGPSTLEWEEAKLATRDAWSRGDTLQY
jgi:hypothetical protein